MNGVPFALLRHAPTIWNEQNRLQGSADIALSLRGRRLAATWRLPPPFDEWQRLASPLQRARQTATLLQPPRNFTVERRLREVRFGIWEGRLIPELERIRRRGVLAPRMEPPAELRRRLRDWASALAHRGSPAVAITHKGVIRAVRRLAGGRGPWRDDRLQVFVARTDGTITLERADVALLPVREAVT
jgi:broad specificity phosphatase PhoE